MSDLLAIRIAQPDLVGLPEWQVADILNAPDPAFPMVRQAVSTKDVQEILLATGEWAKIEITSLSNDSPIFLRSACIILRDTIRQSNTIRTDNPSIYEAVSQVLAGLVEAEFLTVQTSSGLLAMAERQQSWAEANGVEVTPREVSLARGSK
jgi:hypothetical protein